MVDDFNWIYHCEELVSNYA